MDEGNLPTIGIKNKPNKKIIEDDNESNNISIDNNANENVDNLIDNEGKIVINYINKDLQFGNKIRLWSKEFESYNIEDIYLEYLNSVNSIPMLHICIDMFEIVLNDLSKRREYFKKRNDDFVYDNKVVGNNSNEKKKENHQHDLLYRADLDEHHLAVPLCRPGAAELPRRERRYGGLSGAP